MAQFDRLPASPAPRRPHPAIFNKLWRSGPFKPYRRASTSLNSSFRKCTSACHYPPVGPKTPLATTATQSIWLFSSRWTGRKFAPSLRSPSSSQAPSISSDYDSRKTAVHTTTILVARKTLPITVLSPKVTSRYVIPSEIDPLID
jgi:hypothetical protein